MDDFKKETIAQYDAFDLNVKCVRIRNRQKNEHMIKRNARRKNRKKLKKVLDNLEDI